MQTRLFSDRAYNVCVEGVPLPNTGEEMTQMWHSKRPKLDARGKRFVKSQFAMSKSSRVAMMLSRLN